MSEKKPAPPKPSEELPPCPDGEALARRFHEIYERLAPSFGYETRTETRSFDPSTPNGRLMVAVCNEILAAPALHPTVVGVLAAHLERQRAFSSKTFGPGERTTGVLDHIRKELAEIERDPRDVSEWIDVVILAFDGAWRNGHEPREIAAALVAKQEKNEAREWPDWRTADPEKAIEHVRPGLPKEEKP